MNLNALIQSALSEIFEVHSVNESSVVTTQCLYPSGSFVQVTVRGGEHTFYVSDEGMAVQEIESAGAVPSSPDRMIQPIAASFGLLVSKGKIMSQQCSLSDLGLNIALVANASRSAAEWFFDTLKVRQDEKFKAIVSHFLRAKFHSAVQSGVLTGVSNKTHKFDNIIYLRDHRKLVVDSVVNDHNSISSRMVANWDLRSANHSGIEQRIVYDDRDKWKAEDLNILSAAATLVPYSKAWDVLSKFALQ
jgi:hypothetical protein